MKLDDFRETIIEIGNRSGLDMASQENVEKAEAFFIERIVIKEINKLPEELNDPEFRRNFLSQKNGLNDEDLRRHPLYELLPFFERFLCEEPKQLSKVEPAMNKIIYLLLNDKEFKKPFFINNPNKYNLILSICSFNPKLIIFILKDEEIMKAFIKPSFSKIRDILNISQTKRDADFVFSNPLFRTWNEDIKTEIYNTIAHNFAKSLPSTLETFALFAVAKKRIGDQELPMDLEEKIRNLTVQ